MKEDWNSNKQIWWPTDNYLPRVRPVLQACPFSKTPVPNVETAVA